MVHEQSIFKKKNKRKICFNIAENLKMKKVEKVCFNVALNNLNRELQYQSLSDNLIQL